jgi:hypothetical protein
MLPFANQNDWDFFGKIWAACRWEISLLNAKF